jgi:hypothetical protein
MIQAAAEFHVQLFEIKQSPSVQGADHRAYRLPQKKEEQEKQDGRNDNRRQTIVFK